MINIPKYLEAFWTGFIYSVLLSNINIRYLHIYGNTKCHSHTLSYYLHLSKSIRILFAIWLQILLNPSYSFVNWPCRLYVKTKKFLLKRPQLKITNPNYILSTSNPLPHPHTRSLNYLWSKFYWHCETTSFNLSLYLF